MQPKFGDGFIKMNDAEKTPGMETVKYQVPDDIGRIRLDKLIGQNPELKLSRSRLQKLIEAGLVTVDGISAEHNHTLTGGEQITIQIPPQPISELTPEAIPLDIVFEDEHLLVVNKPSGMVTHPGAGNFTGTLVHALLHHAQSLSRASGFDRPGIVHRLDKHTSGLIVVAKTDRVHHALQEQLRERKIKRTYHALVCGHMKEDRGTIDLPIGRSLRDRKKMTVTNHNSREAVTDYILLDRYELYDLLEIQLQTGRTHQIRVHLSHLGHPVFGDPDYGGRTKWHRGVVSAARQTAKQTLKLLDRQALHAKRLEFTHPITDQPVRFDSDLPADFQSVLDLLDEQERS